jgi:hypothetical protein
MPRKRNTPSVSTDSKDSKMNEHKKQINKYDILMTMSDSGNDAGSDPGCDLDSDSASDPENQGMPVEQNNTIGSDVDEIKDMDQDVDDAGQGIEVDKPRSNNKKTIASFEKSKEHHPGAPVPGTPSERRDPSTLNPKSFGSRLTLSQESEIQGTLDPANDGFETAQCKARRAKNTERKIKTNEVAPTLQDNCPMKFKATAESQEPDNDPDDKKSIYVPPCTTNNDWVSSGNKKRREKDMRDKQPKDVAELAYYDSSVKLPGDEMKLNSTWIVWIHENSNPEWDLRSYTSIFNIDSIGSMWRFLSVLDNLDKNVRQYYIMRDGITPIWEDNNNKNGAICSIMIDNMNRNGRHSRGDLGVDAFAAICILVMNESFVKNNMDINGLCYSIKSRSVLIKLWVKDYETNKYFVDKLPITILKALDTVISGMESRGNINKSNGKSRVSVQLKQIKPNY